MSKQHQYLLDTNIISDLIKHPAGIVARTIVEVGEKSICTSIIVAAEIRFGVKKRNSVGLTRQTEAILAELDILPLAAPVDHHYALIRTTLEKRGTPIGPNDMLIAAHALALKLVVITANDNEFSRVPGLATDNWLIPH